MTLENSKYLLDIVPDGLLLGFDSTKPIEAFALQPRAGAGQKPTTLRTKLSGDLDDCLAVLVKLYRTMPSAKHVDLVVGVQRCPFGNGIVGFSDVCELLTSLAHRLDGQIVFQTRSPFVLLLLPLLRRFHVKVTMAFEALDDETHALITPNLPRPSERFHALKALQREGITVAASVFPLLGPKEQPREMIRMVRALTALAGPLSLATEDDRGSLKRPSGCPGFSASRRYFERILERQERHSQTSRVECGATEMPEAA